MASAKQEGLSPEALAADRIAAQESLPLAADIVRRVLHLSVRAVTPLLGLGSVNLIFVVDTDCTEVIVRLSKPTEDAVAKEREYE